MSTLIQRLREHPQDRNLWAAFYRRFHSSVYYTAYKLCGGDAHSAEDLTQETFLRFFQYKAYLRTDVDANVTAYLRQVTRRLSFDACRAKGKEAAQLQHVGQSGLPDSSRWRRRFDGEDLVQLGEDVSRLASYLSESDLELLRRLLSGESIKEAAAEMHLSYQATAVRMHRLRRRIDDHSANTFTSIPKLR
jgi:RNA polymerase sigma factor (sigma-70 family)